MGLKNQESRGIITMPGSNNNQNLDKEQKHAEPPVAERLLSTWINQIKGQQAQTHQQQEQQQQQQQQQQQEHQQAQHQAANAGLEALDEKDVIEYADWMAVNLSPELADLPAENGSKDQSEIWFEWMLKGLKMEHNLDGLTISAKNKLLDEMKRSNVFRDGFDFDYLPDGLSVRTVNKGPLVLRVLCFDNLLKAQKNPLRIKLSDSDSVVVPFDEKHLASLTTLQRSNWEYLVTRHIESCGSADLQAVWEAFLYFNAQYKKLAGDGPDLDFSQFPDSSVKNMQLFLSFLLTIIKNSRNPKEQIELLRSSKMPIDQWGAYYAMRYQGYYLVAPEMELTVTPEQMAQATEDIKQGRSPVPIDYRITRSQLIDLFTQKPPANRADLLRAYYRYIGRQAQASADFAFYKQCAEKSEPGDELLLLILALTSTDKRANYFQEEEKMPGLWGEVCRLRRQKRDPRGVEIIPWVDERGRPVVNKVNEQLKGAITVLLALYKADDFSGVTFFEAATLMRLWEAISRGASDSLQSFFARYVIHLWGYADEYNYDTGKSYLARRDINGDWMKNYGPESKEEEVEDPPDTGAFLYALRHIFANNIDVDMKAYLDHADRIRSTFKYPNRSAGLNVKSDISEARWRERLYYFISRVAHKVEPWSPGVNTQSNESAQAWNRIEKALKALDERIVEEGYSVGRRLLVMLCELPAWSIEREVMVGLLEKAERHFRGQQGQVVSDKALFDWLQGQEGCGKLEYPGLPYHSGLPPFVQESIEKLLRKVKRELELDLRGGEELWRLKEMLERLWNPNDALGEKELEGANLAIQAKAQIFLQQLLDKKAVWFARSSNLIILLHEHPHLADYGFDFLNGLLKSLETLPVIDTKLSVFKKLLNKKRSPENIAALVKAQDTLLPVVAQVAASSHVSLDQRNRTLALVCRYAEAIYDPTLPIQSLAEFLLDCAQHYPSGAYNDLLTIVNYGLKYAEENKKSDFFVKFFMDLQKIKNTCSDRHPNSHIFNLLLHNLVSNERDAASCAQILNKLIASLGFPARRDAEDDEEKEVSAAAAVDLAVQRKDTRGLEILAHTLGRKDSADEVLVFLGLIEQLQKQHPKLYSTLYYLSAHPPKLGIKKLLRNLGHEGQLRDEATLAQNLKSLELDPYFDNPKVLPREVFDVQIVASKIAQIKDPGRHAHGKPRPLFVSQQQELLNWAVAIEALDKEVEGFSVRRWESKEKEATATDENEEEFQQGTHVNINLSASQLTHDDMVGLMQAYRIELANSECPEARKRQVLLESLAIMRRAMHRASKKTPNSSQITSVCATTVRHLEGTRFGQNDTGQGKTLTNAMNAACMWLLHGQALVLTSDPGLAARDLAENQDFFKLLGIPIADQALTQNSSPEDVCRGGVNYSTFADARLFCQEGQLNGDYLARTLLIPEQTGLVIDEVDDSEFDDATGYHSTVPKVASDNPNVSPLVYYYHAMESSFLESAEVKQLREDRKDTATDKDMVKCLGNFLLGLPATQTQQLLLTGLLTSNPKQLETWFESLIRAKEMMQPGVDFAVESEYKVIQGELREIKKVCPYTTSGRSNPRVQYSEGVQQFLQAHMFRTTGDPAYLTPPESDVVLSSNNGSVFYGKFAGVVGLTATMGSAQEISRRLRHSPVHLSILPPHQEKKRKDHLAKCYKGSDAHREAIKEHILGSEPHPVLLITQHPKQVEDLKSWLRDTLPQIGPGLTLQILNGEQSPEEEKEIIRNAGKPGYITLASSLAGRGFDVRPEQKKKEERDQKEEIATQLEVLVIAPPANYRKELQYRGRTGRQGAGGNTHVIVNKDDLITQSGKQVNSLEELYASNEARAYQQWQLNSYVGYIHDAFRPLFLDIHYDVLGLKDEKLSAAWYFVHISFLKALRQKEQALKEHYGFLQLEYDPESPEYLEKLDAFQQDLLAFACQSWQKYLEQFGEQLASFESAALAKAAEAEPDENDVKEKEEKEGGISLDTYDDDPFAQSNINPVYLLRASIQSLKDLLNQQSSWISPQNITPLLPHPEEPYLELPLPSDAEHPVLLMPTLEEAHKKVLAVPVYVERVREEEKEQKIHPREEEEGQEAEGEVKKEEQEQQPGAVKAIETPLQGEGEARAPSPSQQAFLGALTFLVKVPYLESEGVDPKDAETALRQTLMRDYPEITLPEAEAIVLHSDQPARYTREGDMLVQGEEGRFCELTKVRLQIDPATACLVYVDYVNGRVYTDLNPQPWVDPDPAPKSAPKKNKSKSSTHYAPWLLLLLLCLAGGTAFTVTGTAASLGIPYIATWSLTSAFSLATLSTFNFWVLMGLGAAAGLAVFLTVLGTVKLGQSASGSKPAGKGESREEGALEGVELDPVKQALQSQKLQERGQGYTRVQGQDDNQNLGGFKPSTGPNRK